ncbi:MAG: DUF3489 domain-containing protein [Betaproteobacteria bacterium]|nr:DUF3489 domain-containing protein [Betaproteobacteria bacterium]
MNTDIKLTDTQQKILSVAAYRMDGNIEPLPPNLRGGARVKVIDGLLTREMIQIVQKSSETFYCLTDVAYAALGRHKPAAAAPAKPETVREAKVGQPDTAWGPDQSDACPTRVKPNTREHSKQATVIEMLQRPNGATIHEICEATGWQAHTVRGTFAGALKKKLGLNITSFKDTGASRVYRIL